MTGGGLRSRGDRVWGSGRPHNSMLVEHSVWTAVTCFLHSSPPCARPPLLPTISSAPHTQVGPIHFSPHQETDLWPQETGKNNILYSFPCLTHLGNLTSHCGNVCSFNKCFVKDKTHWASSCPLGLKASAANVTTFLSLPSPLFLYCPMKFITSIFSSSLIHLIDFQSPNWNVASVTAGVCVLSHGCIPST